MASPNLSEIVSTTLRNRAPEVANNVVRNNALLMYLNERGNSRPFSGGRTITQPLTSATPAAPVEIRVTLAPIREDRCPVTGGQLATSKIITNFWIRARSQDPALDRRRTLEIAQLLKAILTNPDARYTLANYGIAHLNPRTPQLISSTHYVLYLLVCHTDLSYEIKYT